MFGCFADVEALFWIDDDSTIKLLSTETVDSPWSGLEAMDIVDVFEVVVVVAVVVVFHYKRCPNRIVRWHQFYFYFFNTRRKKKYFRQETQQP
jgi:hypothetical protein